MAISLGFELKSEILYVIAKGDHTVESAIETLKELLRHAKKINVKNIIIDCRLIKNLKHSILVAFEYSESLSKEQSNLEFHPNLAYVFTSVYLDEIRQFGENVAVNRGVIVQAFDDILKAEKWLMKLNR